MLHNRKIFVKCSFIYNAYIISNGSLIYVRYSKPRLHVSASYSVDRFDISNKYTYDSFDVPKNGRCSAIAISRCAIFIFPVNNILLAYNNNPISAGSFAPLLLLHEAQAIAKLDALCSPPLDSG